MLAINTLLYTIYGPEWVQSDKAWLGAMMGPEAGWHTLTHTHMHTAGKALDSTRMRALSDRKAHLGS